MRARIFERPKGATQSGMQGAGVWVLDYGQETREHNDPLMGWWGSGNTQAQVRLAFETKEAAIAYAEANSIEYEIELPPPSKPIKPKAYADNFRYGRAENWTH